MKGYKTYYNKNTRKFEFEETMSEVLTMPCDSTTSWFTNLKYAIEAADNSNSKLQYVKICKQCGESFWQMPEEIKWYEDRHLTPPNRCYLCRKNKGAR